MNWKPASPRSQRIASALADHQDAVLLAVGLCLLAGASVARFVFPDPTNGVTLFALIPVGLFGLVFGIRGGFAAAVLASLSFAAWAVIQEAEIQALGYVTRVTALIATGLMVGYLSDLSYRTSLAQAELSDRARELERSNVELAHFAQAAAHDLSEPLRTVSGYLDLLERRHGDGLEKDADEYLQVALHGTVRMRALLDALLDFSKLDTGELRRTTVDSAGMIDDVLEGIRLAIEETGAVVRVHSVPTIEGDPAQLGRLFQNLISNAVKFVEHRTPVIDVSAAREGEGWRFAIADNGIGIDPGRAEEIFDMFRRLHPRHEYEGSGIGLAMCKRIVERHGGRIWVESIPGEGSTFYFTIADRIPERTPAPEPRLPALEPESDARSAGVRDSAEPAAAPARGRAGRLRSLRSIAGETVALAGAAPSQAQFRRSPRRRPS